MDFSTIKNELFPIIASVFSKTSSLGIKVRGLEAFVILCGGSDSSASNDGLDGVMNSNANKKSSSTALDKYTMQEKIVPLIRAIKTKEPAVAIAALNVLRQVGGIVDSEFVAMDVLPILWSMSLGPLLNLQQFQSFMELIKSLSARVESEQSRKLQELSGSNGSHSQANDDFMSFSTPNAFPTSNVGDSSDVDFESLVKGKVSSGLSSPMDATWDSAPAQAQRNVPIPRVSTPSFAWSSPSPTTQTSSNNLNSMAAIRPQQGPASRTITPDLSRFDTLTPSSTQFSQPLQPQQANYSIHQPQSAFPQPQQNYTPQPLQPTPISNYPSNPSSNWGSSTTPSNPWAPSPSSNPSLAALGSSMSSISMNQQRPTMNMQSSSFSLPPPPGVGAFTPPPQQQRPPQQMQGFPGAFRQPPAQKKSGLDAYESLI